MRVRRAVLVFGLLAATQSWAARWIAISGTEWPPAAETKMILEIDTDSIRLRDGYRQAWVRYNHNPPVPSIIYGKSKGSVVVLELFDCRNEESATVTGTEYAQQFGGGESFNPFERTRQQAIASMKPPIPGSFGDSALKFVCTRPLK